MAISGRRDKRWDAWVRVASSGFDRQQREMATGVRAAADPLADQAGALTCCGVTGAFSCCAAPPAPVPPRWSALPSLALAMLRGIREPFPFLHSAAVRRMSRVRLRMW